MNTDKKTQTVYTPITKESERVLSYSGKKIENVYLYTPEELEALKAKWGKEQWISVKDRLPKDYQTVLWFDKRDEKINLGYFVFFLKQKLIM